MTKTEKNPKYLIEAGRDKVQEQFGLSQSELDRWANKFGPQELGYADLKVVWKTTQDPDAFDYDEDYQGGWG